MRYRFKYSGNSRMNSLAGGEQGWQETLILVHEPPSRKVMKVD